MMSAAMTGTEDIREDPHLSGKKDPGYGQMGQARCGHRQYGEPYIVAL